MQRSALALQDIKTRARHVGPGREIEDPSALSEIPVRLHLEVTFHPGRFISDDDIGLFVRTNRYRIFREVWQNNQEIMELPLNLLLLRLNGLDTLANRPHLGDLLGRRPAAPAHFIALRTQLIALVYQRASLRIKFNHLIDRRIFAAV